MLTILKSLKDKKSYGYWAHVYLTPVFEEEDLKLKNIPKNTYKLQTLQNQMIRVIYGIKKQNHTSLKNIREEIKMMSVNQIAVYYTILESYNIVKNSAPEEILSKWTNENQNYSLRRIAQTT